MAGLSTLTPFPFCIPTVSAGEVGRDTDYPIGVDYETLFKWYYRVKTWRVEVACSTITATASLGGANASAAIPSDQSDLTTTNIATESNFVCTTMQVTNTGVNLTDSDSDAVGDFTADASVSFLGATFTMLSVVDPPVVQSGGLYYPSITLSAAASANASTTDASGSPTLNYGISRNAAIDLTGPDNWPVLMDGNAFNIAALVTEIVQPDGDAGCAVVLDLSLLEININPEEYWPYDPGDGGGPIYDSTTGTELRDPFSVQEW